MRPEFDLLAASSTDRREAAPGVASPRVEPCCTSAFGVKQEASVNRCEQGDQHVVFAPRRASDLGTLRNVQ